MQQKSSLKIGEAFGTEYTHKKVTKTGKEPSTQRVYFEDYLWICYVLINTFEVSSFPIVLSPFSYGSELIWTLILILLLLLLLNLGEFGNLHSKGLRPNFELLFLFGNRRGRTDGFSMAMAAQLGAARAVRSAVGTYVIRGKLFFEERH